MIEIEKIGDIFRKRLKENRHRVLYNYLVIIAVFVILSVLITLFRGNFFLTGLIVLDSDLSSGNYNNTEYNGSAVVLSSGDYSGTYESEIIDAGSGAVWNSLNWIGREPDAEFLYAVDGSGAVYESKKSGANWTQKTSDYGRGSNTADMISDSDNLYIIFSGNKKEIYKSADNGVSWSIINDSFSNKALLVGAVDSSGNLYAATGPGVVWKSADSGISWTELGDFNSDATNNAKGIAINSNDNIFIVDGAGDVYMSEDFGESWTKQNDSYGGETGTDDLEIDSNDYLYILLNKKVYKSADDGVSWSIINDSFTSYTQNGLKMLIDSEDNFFIIDKKGKVWKSDDSGISWAEISDFNSDLNKDCKGFSSLIKSTNLNFKIRNCSVSDCSDSEFVSRDLEDLDLKGRYFQYKAEFSSDDSEITPQVESVSIDYNLLCRENWTVHYTECNISDNKIKYYLDANSCNTTDNLPADNNTIESCDYCSFSSTNTSFAEWENFGECLINNVQQQNRSKTEYDENYDICYAVTGLESDLWNNGDNKTYWDYQNISCDYCVLNLTSTNSSCYENNTLIESFSDLNDCYNLTNLSSDLVPEDEIHNCTYEVPAQESSGGGGVGERSSVGEISAEKPEAKSAAEKSKGEEQTTNKNIKGAVISGTEKNFLEKITAAVISKTKENIKTIIPIIVAIVVIVGLKILAGHKYRKIKREKVKEKKIKKNAD